VLSRGDVVQVLPPQASDGDYYRIASPPGSVVFVPPGVIRKATEAELAQPNLGVDAKPATTTAELPEETPQTVASEAVVDAEEAVDTAANAAASESEEDVVFAELVVETEGASSATPPTLKLDGQNTAQAPAAEPQPEDDGLLSASKGGSPVAEPTSGALAEVEAAMAPLFALPLEEQPHDEMAAAYQALLEQPLAESDKQYVAVRLAAIERNKKLAQAIARIEAAKTQANAAATQQVDLKTLADDPEASAAASSSRPVNYDAVGHLVASSVYDGQTLPRMFRLVDATSRRTLAYVRPGGLVEPRQTLGRLVGIVGESQYDATLKLSVISVERIDVLGASD